MLSHGSVTVVVVVPEVRTNVVVPDEVTMRVEQTWQGSVVVVIPSSLLGVGVETIAELLGVVVVLLLTGTDELDAGTLEVEDTVDVETNVEEPEELVDSMTV